MREILISNHKKTKGMGGMFLDLPINSPSISLQYSHVPNLQVATQIVSLQLTRGWNNLAEKQNKNKQTEQQQKAPDIDGIIWWVDQWMACSPQTRCDSVVEHRSAETESLRFDSSWELRIVSLSHARDKTKKRILFFQWAQNSPSFLFYFNQSMLWISFPEGSKHYWLKYLILLWVL